MSESDRRAPRRRGPRTPEAPPAEPAAVEVEVAVRPAPVRAAPPPPAAPSPRAPTDFDGLRAVAEMDAADVRALMESYGGGQRQGALRVGQRVRGRVTSVGQQSVFVDVGGKADASIDRLELTQVELGETIEAFVVSTDGEVRLTRTPSGSAAREMLAEAQTAKMPVSGKVTAVSDSGWQVQLADGIGAFCPGSHTGAGEVGDPGHVGQSFPFLVHDLRGRDVVLSRRALVEAEERAAAAERYGALNVNDVLEGPVTRVADFGAFVKLPGGLEGMVHISNLADRRIKHPSDVVKEGDVVKVRVLAVDRARRRVDLGMKQAADGGSTTPAPDRPGSSRGFDVFAALLKDVRVKR